MEEYKIWLVIIEYEIRYRGSDIKMQTLKMEKMTR